MVFYLWIYCTLIRLTPITLPYHFSLGSCAQSSHLMWKKTPSTCRQRLETEHSASHGLGAISTAIFRQWDLFSPGRVGPSVTPTLAAQAPSCLNFLVGLCWTFSLSITTTCGSVPLRHSGRVFQNCLSHSCSLIFKFPEYLNLKSCLEENAYGWQTVARAIALHQPWAWCSAFAVILRQRLALVREGRATNHCALHSSKLPAV